VSLVFFSVATEDKYGSSVPLEEASSDDEEKKVKQPAEDPMGRLHSLAHLDTWPFIYSSEYSLI